jgi:hypothetical protein
MTSKTKIPNPKHQITNKHQAPMTQMKRILKGKSKKEKGKSKKKIQISNSDIPMTKTRTWEIPPRIR